MLMELLRNHHAGLLKVSGAAVGKVAQTAQYLIEAHADNILRLHGKVGGEYSEFLNASTIKDYKLILYSLCPPVASIPIEDAHPYSSLPEQARNLYLLGYYEGLHIYMTGQVTFYQKLVENGNGDKIGPEGTNQTTLGGLIVLKNIVVERIKDLLAKMRFTPKRG